MDIEKIHDLAQGTLSRLFEGYEEAAFEPDGLVAFLLVLREMRAAIATLALQVERDYVARAPARRYVVAGLGEVEIRRNTARREWDHDALTATVVARALDERIVDEATGEYESAFQAVARVLSECARPEWRLTPLRARGIDPDEFSVTEDRGWKVVLP